MGQNYAEHFQEPALFSFLHGHLAEWPARGDETRASLRAWLLHPQQHSMLTPSKNLLPHVLWKAASPGWERMRVRLTNIAWQARRADAVLCRRWRWPDRQRCGLSRSGWRSTATAVHASAIATHSMCYRARAETSRCASCCTLPEKCPLVVRKQGCTGPVGRPAMCYMQCLHKSLA